MEDKALLELLGSINSKLEALSTDVNEVKSDLNQVKATQDGVLSTLEVHSNSLRKIEVTQENITNRNISLLMESLSGTNEKIGKLDEMDASLQDVKSDVEVIKDVVTGHTHSIADLKAVK